MPDAPLRFCPCSPTCPVRVKAGQRCQQGAQRKEQYRGSRHTRGYDSAWVRLRAAFLRNPDNVLCARCKEQDRVSLTTEVDHIIPFKGIADPLRLDIGNLMGMCADCHDVKHGASRRARGASW